MIFSSVTSYSYWSAFHLPLNGQASLDLLFSSSFEFIVLGGLLLTVCITVFDIFTSIMDKHPHVNIPFKRPDSLPYLISCVLLSVVFAFFLLVHPSSSGKAITSFLLLILMVYFNQSNKVNSFNHKYRLAIQKLSFCKEGTLGRDIYAQILDYNNLDNEGAKEFNRVFFIVSFCLMVMLGASFSSIKASLIKDSIAFSYIESYNGDKLKYIGYAMGSNILISEDGSLISKKSVNNLKYKEPEFSELF